MKTKQDSKVISTPRGTFRDCVIMTGENAWEVSECRRLLEEEGYGYYFTNDDGIDVYVKHTGEYTITVAGLRKVSIQDRTEVLR